MDAYACTDEQENQSAPSSSHDQVESVTAAQAQLASSISESVVQETAVDLQCHVCTQAPGDDDRVGGGNGCINFVTLCNIWRLEFTTIDTDNAGSTLDDLFMIPIEESRIGQHSSSHELVID